jgi:hypothetical protein
MIICGICLLGYLVSIISELVAHKQERKRLKHNKRVSQFLSGIGKVKNTALEKIKEKADNVRYIYNKYNL